MFLGVGGRVELKKQKQKKNISNVTLIYMYLCSIWLMLDKKKFKACVFPFRNSATLLKNVYNLLRLCQTDTQLMMAF